MPLYIDHHDLPGVSPEQLADAHEADVAAQEKHGVRYHTYWFDPESGAVFCLAGLLLLLAGRRHIAER